MILKYAIILCHNIFPPKPTGILLMNNVIQDKHKQRDIVIQFCNSLYEKTVLTIIKSVWYLKYAEIKQILYDFKSIFHTLFWDVLLTKLIDEYL